MDLTVGCWVGSAKRQKMAVALAFILMKINREAKKTNTSRTLFQPFWRYLSNNLGLVSMFNVKISSNCLERKWA